MDSDQVNNFDLTPVNGEPLWDLKYADDAALLSKSRQGLSSFAQVMNERSQKHGLEMNVKRTKLMSSIDYKNDDMRI